MVQTMNRSNPSSELGGGEMNRATSRSVSSANNDDASDWRSSRRTTCLPHSTGSPSRQLALVSCLNSWTIVWVIIPASPVSR